MRAPGTEKDRIHILGENASGGAHQGGMEHVPTSRRIQFKKNGAGIVSGEASQLWTVGTSSTIEVRGAELQLQL